MEGAASYGSRCLATVTHAMEGDACYGSFRRVLAMMRVITLAIPPRMLSKVQHAMEVCAWLYTFTHAMEGAACYGRTTYGFSHEGSDHSL